MGFLPPAEPNTERGCRVVVRRWGVNPAGGRGGRYRHEADVPYHAIRRPPGVHLRYQCSRFFGAVIADHLHADMSLALSRT